MKLPYEVTSLNYPLVQIVDAEKRVIANMAPHKDSIILARTIVAKINKLPWWCRLFEQRDARQRAYDRWVWGK